MTNFEYDYLYEQYNYNLEGHSHSLSFEVDCFRGEETEEKKCLGTIEQKSTNNIIEVTEENKSTDPETKKLGDELKSIDINLKKENLNQDNIINKLKENLEPVLKKKRGRPKTKSGGIIHDKFSDDNMRRKCKHITLQNAMNFINDKIKEKYGTITQGILTKKLLTINQRQIFNATISFNKNFLNKRLGDIFSEDISKKYTNYPHEHNKNLISSLIKDENEERGNYFKNLFNITFLDCLKHFRGNKFIPELEGLKPFGELVLESDMDKDYFTNLKFYIDHYETITNNKKERKKYISGD